MKENMIVCHKFEFARKSEADAFLKGIEFCNPEPILMLKEESSIDKEIINELNKAELIVSIDYRML